MKIHLLAMAAAMLFSASVYAQDTTMKNKSKPVKQKVEKRVLNHDSIPKPKPKPDTLTRQRPNEYPELPIPSPEPRREPSEGNEGNNPVGGN